MSELTFEQKFVQEWERFCEYSNNKSKTDEEVIAAEADMDQDLSDLVQAFSHPPGKPNRRRP